MCPFRLNFGECRGQVRGGPCLPHGERAECPQIRAPAVSGFYLLLKLEFMKYCAPDFKAGESSRLSLRGTQFIPLSQSVTSKTRFHCKIVWYSGVGLAPLGKGLEMVVTQNSEELLTHLSPPCASARGPGSRGQEAPRPRSGRGSAEMWG